MGLNDVQTLIGDAEPEEKLCLGLKDAYIKIW